MPLLSSPATSPRSSSSTGWLPAIHLVALATWFGALLAAGLTAALVFPAMRRVAPILPDFAAYPGEHWKIAAGSVANRVFLVVDSIQLACAVIAILTLGLTFAAAGKAVPGLRIRPPLGGARLALLTIASTLLCYELFILSPRMAIHLSDYWAAAREGRLAAADIAKAAFDADHPTASGVLSTTAVAVLLSIVAAALGTARGRAGPSM